MYGSANFKSVPIIDVTKENVATVGSVVRGAIIGSDFIAIDCVSIQEKLTKLHVYDTILMFFRSSFFSK